MNMRIDSMPLPARKCIRLDLDGSEFCEVKQEKRRVKHYAYKQFKAYEPETADRIEAVVKAVNSHDALVRELHNVLSICKDLIDKGSDGLYGGEDECIAVAEDVLEQAE